jgi:3-phenylpropionate/trans-cinnamate dioxygenase ferredoxin reductase subunit
MRVVIVGAGQAGGWAAKSLLDSGFKGEVVLIGDEFHPPYQRPPLSKEILLGEKPPESTYLWPDGLPIQFLTGIRVQKIDRLSKSLWLSDQREVRYDKLILATGGRVRRLDIPGAHYLRTIEDAIGLRISLLAGGNVLVVGGGWIGLEAAAAARLLGCDVTVVEAADRLCGRVMPAIVSDYLKDLHERHGVEVRVNGTLNLHTASTIVVGIGIVPNVELAQEAGLTVDNGIRVDRSGVTSDPDILAVGDVANVDGIRLESWANAQNQAVAAAKTLAGVPTPYREIPWFWSNQYHVNLQFLGLPKSGQKVILRGDPTLDKFTLFFLDDSHIAAVVAANNMRDLKIARKLMESNTPVEPDVLADTSKRLEDLLCRPSNVVQQSSDVTQ